MKNVKKITSILIIVSMTIVMFAGCSSTKAANNKNTNSRTRKFDPTATKKLYSDTLTALVTDGTITQAQSDKVLETETNNVPQSSGTSKPAETTKENSGNKPTGTRPKNNRLSELVTSAVITQAQADTINIKISEAMKNSRNK